MIRIDKGKIPIAILIIIMAIGLYLRSYHIDYPPIGYHSMKEVHYLSVAKGYLDYGDFLHKRVLYSGMSEGPGYIEAFPQFQFLPYIYFALWKIFGVKVWIARLVVIVFSLGVVSLTYAVAKRLGATEEASLVAAFFMMAMPLSVFFGRNIQPDMPALLFLLLSTYFFLKWIEDFKVGHIVYFSISVFLTAIIKGTFLFLLIPMVFLFPYGMLADSQKRMKIVRQSIVFVCGIVLVCAWLLFTKLTLVYSRSLFPGSRLFLGGAFTLRYWKLYLPVVWKHIGENYTYFCFGLFAVGFFLSFLNLKSNMSKYIIGSFVGLICYFLLISDFAVRHSYYHIPFLPMICFGIAVALREALSIVDLTRRWYLKYIVLAVILFFTVQSIRANTNKFFDILMMGTDIAGRYVEEHSDESDRILISYGSPSNRAYEAFRTQFYGALWEANRRGEILPVELDSLKRAEMKRNVNWILWYRTEWLPGDKVLLDYIHGNYSIQQIGIKDDTILYLLFRRGGTFDLSPFEDREPEFARRYEFSYGHVDLFVKER